MFRLPFPLARAARPSSPRSGADRPPAVASAGSIEQRRDRHALDELALIVALLEVRRDIVGLTLAIPLEERQRQMKELEDAAAELRADFTKATSLYESRHGRAGITERGIRRVLAAVGLTQEQPR